MGTQCLNCTPPLASTTTATKLDDDDLHYAASHVLNSRPLDDEDDPRRWLMIAVDPAGRLLELVALVYDDGYELIIHAMKARSQYIDDL